MFLLNNQVRSIFKEEIKDMEDFADVQFLFLKIHCDILYSLVCLHICSTLPWLGLAIYIFVCVWVFLLRFLCVE